MVQYSGMAEKSSPQRKEKQAGVKSPMSTKGDGGKTLKRKLFAGGVNGEGAEGKKCSVVSTSHLKVLKYDFELVSLTATLASKNRLLC